MVFQNISHIDRTARKSSMQKLHEILKNLHKPPDDDRQSKRCPGIENTVWYLKGKKDKLYSCRSFKKNMLNWQLQK